MATVCLAPAYSLPHLALGSVVAALLPLFGVGRRLAPANLLQVVALSQAACYALVVCQGGTPGISWRFLPEVYLAIGAAGGAAVLLMGSSMVLSWYASLCGGMQLAEFCFNMAHVMGALGIGACAHLGWDILLAATKATPAPLSPVSYAWDWATVVVGTVVLQQLGGLRWSHVRLKIVGAMLFASAVLLALLRRGSNSGTVYNFNSYVMIPLHLLLLQAFGHLERHNPMRPPRRPHNPLAPILALVQRLKRQRYQKRHRRSVTMNMTPVELGTAPAAAQDAAGVQVSPGGAEQAAAPAPALVVQAAQQPEAPAQQDERLNGAKQQQNVDDQLHNGHEQEKQQQQLSTGHDQADQEDDRAVEAREQKAEPKATDGDSPIQSPRRQGDTQPDSSGDKADALGNTAGPANATTTERSQQQVQDEQQQRRQPEQQQQQKNQEVKEQGRKGQESKQQEHKEQEPPQPSRTVPTGPLVLEDVLTVCRLPALGKLFMMHLGPNVPPGQEEALSSGAFRLPFKSGDADRDWSHCWSNTGASGVPRDECAAASALMGRFPATLDPEAALNLLAAGPAGVTGTAAAAGPSLPDATLAALEGALFRVRPLTRFQQQGDPKPRPHGIHPLVLQNPMVDEPAARAAMELIYAATTRGNARALWPAVAKAPQGAAGAASAGPLLLAAPQTNEAAVVRALQMALGGQNYTNISAAGGAAGAGGSGADDALRPVGRGATGALSAKVQAGLPVLPAEVREHLQDLLNLIENGQVNIHLCPRAALTGETPCGHYVRVWAVMAPSGPSPTGKNAVLTASGHIVSTGHGTGMSSHQAVAAASASRSLALPSSGMNAAPPSSRGRPGALQRSSNSMGPLNERALVRLSSSTGLEPMGGSFGHMQSMAGRASAEVMMRRMRSTELMRTSSANTSAAINLSSLFAPQAPVDEDSGSDADEETSFSDSPRALTTGSGALLGRAHSAPREAGLSGRPGRVFSTPARAGAGGGRYDRAYSGPSGGSGGSTRRSASVSRYDRVSSMPAAGHAARRSRSSNSRLDRAHSARTGIDIGRSYSSAGASGSGSGAAAFPVAAEAISHSAYIDGTMAPGGALDEDGQLIEPTQAGGRPSASHGFDRVLSGAASTFQDVLEASAEAARASYTAFVDENCPSVAEALIHSWLSLKGHSLATCRLGEAWCTAMRVGLQQELTEQAPSAQSGGADGASSAGAVSGAGAPASPPLVSQCQAADMTALTPSEVLEVVSWAAASPRGEITQRAITVEVSGAVPPAATAAATAAGCDTVAPEQLLHLLRALRAHMLARAVDGAWLQETYPYWRSSLLSIMADSQAARLAAEEAEALDLDGTEGGSDSGAESTHEEDPGGGQEQGAGSAGGDGGLQEGEPEEELDVQQRSGPASQACVEALLSNAAGWCIQRRTVTTGTMSLLRQVQRICLEAAVPALLDAILECAKHEPGEYISDIDLMTVYLEQIGIANEVMQFFGINKFRLGRILWLRHRAALPEAAGIPNPSGAAEEVGAEDAASGGGVEAVISIPATGGATSAAAGAAAPAEQQMQRAVVAEVAVAAAGTGSQKQPAPGGDGGDKEAAQKVSTGAAAAPEVTKEKRAAAAEAALAEDDDDAAGHTAMFTLWVGNGLFWTFPFMLQWLASRTIGSGLIDNGRLDNTRFGWMVWSFFLAYFVAGGYFNLIMHLLLYHRWRYSMPSMLMATLQGLVSSIFVYGVFCGALAAYALLRHRSGEMAWFTCVAFFLMSLYVTQLLMLACTSTEENTWTSGPGRTILGIFLLQTAVNQASYRLSTGRPVMENLLCLAAFMVIAGICLWRSLRRMQATWAEALLSPKGAKLSRPALLLLLSFHNATFVTRYTPESPQEDLNRAASTAGGLLLKKLIALRRLRLPLFYDSTAWVLPAGSLTHLMITIPYWTSELWLGSRWLGENSVPLALSALFVLTSGAYLEWLVALMSNGEPELTAAQRAALVAAAAEQEVQAAAARAWRPQGGGDAVDASGGGARRSAVCSACGAAGCSPGCGDMLRHLVAPPNARCFPRGPSFFFGWSFGFSPLRDTLRPGGAAAPPKGSRKEYWQQLSRIMAWQAGMWLFGLFVVAMMVASESRRSISSVKEYVNIVWANRTAAICFTMMVVGYGLYLLVGFNAAMGRPVRMRHSVVALFCSQAASCLFLAALQAWVPASREYAPAASVGLAGALYLASTLSDDLADWLKGLLKGGASSAKAGAGGSAAAAGAQEPTSGQPALSNTLANKCEAVAALHRLKTGGHAAPVRLDPSKGMGKQVLQLLRSRVRAKHQQQPARATAAAAGGPNSTAAREEPGCSLTGLTEKQLFVAAYPEAAPLVAKAAEGFEQGRVRLWLVPFEALNPKGAPPQYYAVALSSAAAAAGKPASGAGRSGATASSASKLSIDIYLAADPLERPEKGSSWAAQVLSEVRPAEPPASRRPGAACTWDVVLSAAEALLHEVAKAEAPAVGPQRLDACAAETALLGFFWPPRRVQRELDALPSKVLAGMARRTPASIVCGAVRQLAAAAVEGVSTARGVPAEGPNVLEGVDGRLIDGAWDLLSPEARVALLHLCRQAVSTAATTLSSTAAATAAGGGGGGARPAACAANTADAALGSGAAAAQACLGLLAAVEVQQLGQQVTFSPTNGGGAAGSGPGAEGSTARPVVAPEVIARQVARAAVVAGMALAVHDAVTGGRRQSWRLPGAAGAERQLSGTSATAGTGPDGQPHVALKADQLQQLAAAQERAAQASGAGRPALKAGSSLRRRAMAGAIAAGQVGSFGRAPSLPTVQEKRQQDLQQQQPQGDGPEQSKSNKKERAEAAAAAPAVAAGASPAAAAAAANAAALWQRLPLHRRFAYHVHIALRTLWLAIMGDPSFWQDAVDLVGNPPSSGSAAGTSSAGIGDAHGEEETIPVGPHAAALAAAWLGWAVRMALLRFLKYAARISQALTFLAYRWCLWWWPGLHEVLLAAARGGALTAVSIYDSAGRLRRMLRFSRQGVSTAVHRAAGPVSRRHGKLGGEGPAAAAVAAVPGPAGLAQLAEALEAAAAVSARGPLAEPEDDVFGDQLSEGLVSRAAGRLALDHLGVKFGELVLVDEAPGATATVAADKVSSTTCYLVPRPAPGGVLSNLGLRLGLAKGPLDGAWLPLWQWEPSEKLVRVWDYGQRAVEESEAGRKASFLDHPALGKLPATPSAAPHTTRVLPCEQPGAAAPLQAACWQLAGQLREASEAAGHKPQLAGGPQPWPAAHRAHPRIVASYGAAGDAAGISVRRPPLRDASPASSGAGAAAPGAQGFRAPAAGQAASARNTLEAAAIQVQLDAEPPMAPPLAPPAALGTLTIDFGAAVGISVTQDAARSAHAGTHALALLRSERSVFVRDAELPEWVVQQLRLADRASDGCARSLPPIAAVLRNSQGEQWLLCCDALATASVGANLGRLWPRQPQGVRCWYSRGSLTTNAWAEKAGSAPSGGAGGGGRAGLGGRTSLRNMRFLDTPLHPPLAALNEAEIGFSSSNSSAPRGGSPPGSFKLTGSVNTAVLAAAAAQWTMQSAVPEWMAAALEGISVPWAPSAAAAPWHVPAGVPLQRAGGAGVAPHAAPLPDAGLSRAFLWWVWNQGSDGMNKLLAPPEPEKAEKGGGEAGGGGKGGATGAWPAAAAWLRSKLGLGKDGGGRKAVMGLVLDGLLTTAVEEAVLRREPLLRRYWRAYDALDGPGCRAVRDDDVALVQFAIGSAILSNTPTHHSHMAHSLDTLAACNYVPGNSYSYYNPLAGLPSPSSSSPATSSPGAAGRAASLPPLKAVAMDSGTWPMDGGGVATCREQVCQGTDDVSWHAEAEVAHDLKQVIIKMRAQPNVSQVALTIQWDTQHDSPNQSTFCSVPYTRLTRRAYVTTPEAVRECFIPLWRCLLVALRKANYTSEGADSAAIGQAFCDMWEYFQTHDWDMTWADPKVGDAFAYEMKVAAASTPNTCVDSQQIGGPEPTMGELSSLLDLMQHYLKTMCLTVPPDASVIQASHHGLQGLAGLVAQLLNGQSLQVWEHGVLMRERLIYLDCFKRNLLPHFVNEQLTRLHRLAGQALYRLSDMVVPCNATFNTSWELWLGTDPNRLMPLLNALEIEHYPCLQDNEAPEPTAAMLSHVYALKDIMSAIRAAAIIVHDYGVKEYKLEVYGSLDFDRDYVTGCHKLIKQLKLEDNVALRGLGAPIKVLSMTWIYIQTSISEGLPVSVIEAGLTGKCVVCTNVGGCAELLANPNAGADGSSHGLVGPQPPMFGRLVAPKDAEMIAYAQLEVLGYLPTLQIPKLLKPPEVDLEELRKRIHDPEVKRQRHALGRLFRQFGLDQFRMSRYILQHRQALFTPAFKREAMARIGGYDEPC